MGKGGYLGGSTIVGGFGWSSFDPASTGAKHVKRKAKRGQPSPQATSKGDLDGDRKQTGRRRPAKPDVLRIIYLEAIIDAALRAQPAPFPPRAVREKLRAETVSAGGAIAWAKRQPEYAAILKKRQKRLAGKTSPKCPDRCITTVRQPISGKPKLDPTNSGPANRTASIEALCSERARLSTALIAFEAEASEHRRAIAEIDRLLAARKSVRR